MGDEMERYPSTSKSTHVTLHTLIDEQVDVKLETVDNRTALLSIAVMGSPLYEGKLGVAVAMRNDQLKRIRDAITTFLSGLT
jgi:hypothetical protein